MIYLTEQDAARAGLTKPREKRGRGTRPDIPAAGPSERVGLSGLIAGKDRTWCYAFVVGRGHRFYRTGVDTGYCDTLAAACQVAKGMEK